jgi:S-DNA-T family DNA segregation ATPase FtsK/SpoIIIE
VRDLSVPSTRTGKASKSRIEEPAIEKGELEGEVISAKELAAASTADILGKRAESAKKADRVEDESTRTADQSAGKAASSPALRAPPSDGGEGRGEEEPDKLEPAAATPDSIKITDNTGAARKPAPRKKPIAVASTPLIGNYQLPPMDFLQFPDQAIKPTESKEDLMANARLMQQTLAQFDIEVSLGDITKGPTITRYELHPAPGVKLEKIVALNNNIAAALKAERINILAPVPGKSSVGIEVPNIVKTKVIIRDLLESEEWQKSKARIPLALGKDVYGHPIVADLAEMPHLLIAGSTGSGKSVSINAIIASLLYKFPPDQLRFVMIDPKVVELQQYNALPHLVVPVVNDPKKVILALRWVVNEMEKRYQIFARVGVRNIKSFNERPKGKHAAPLPQQELPLTSKKEKVEPGADGFAVEVDEEIVVPRDDDIVIPEKLSYIVVIIDELADLMLVAPADVEMAIARITQMARAAGIHCIVATQRPSVDVITGVIKANIPARIAFQVAARVDSRTILDAMGADKLLGKGDMLYLPPGSAKLIRAQGALITDQEIQHVVDYIAKQGKPSYEMEIHQQLSRPVSSLDHDSGCGEDEALIEQCIEVIRSEHKASVSLLQRRLKLGYGRAARIMDELENRGIVGPSKGAEPRDILIDLDGEGADGRGVDTAAR